MVEVAGRGEGWGKGAWSDGVVSVNEGKLRNQGKIPVIILLPNFVDTNESFSSIASIANITSFIVFFTI